MQYFVSIIIVTVSAMVILFTRYEADDSVIQSEIERAKTMFSMVDSFVNTYIESGESLTTVNFEELEDNGILLSTATVTGTAKESILTLPNSDVRWQVIPNHEDTSSYKVLVDFRNNTGLMSKVIFSESFIGREYCEKALFGTLQRSAKTYNDATLDDETFDLDGNNGDGFLLCIVYK